MHEHLPKGLACPGGKRHTIEGLESLGYAVIGCLVGEFSDELVRFLGAGHGLPSVLGLFPHPPAFERFGQVLQGGAGSSNFTASASEVQLEQVHSCLEQMQPGSGELKPELSPSQLDLRCPASGSSQQPASNEDHDQGQDYREDPSASSVHRRLQSAAGHAGGVRGYPPACR
jgi:hypothetical protein